MFGSAQERLAQAEARVGKTLRGKYAIERVLGVGGMASVYEATHRNGRRVAVKVLHVAVSLNADMRRRFLREGQAANAVKHPGAVVVIDDDVTEDGAAFLVMELLEGQVVEQLWHRSGERLAPELVLAIGYELCSVLEAAHHAGIIHRDIKPENLFLTRSGQLKVLDFGLARLRDQPKMTAIGMVFGTPAFMAPEQASGRASQVDARTDLWSAGATMFTLLSGETVHVGDTVQDLLVRAARKPARSLATVMPGADPRLVRLVDRALELDKEARWPSGAAMRAAIGETCVALYGEAALKLPSADALLLLPAGSQQPTVERARLGSDLSIADLTASGDLTSGGVTEADRAPPRWSDRPTAELGAGLPTIVEEDAPPDAVTLPHRVAPPDAPPPQSSLPVGPPTPANGWGIPASPPPPPGGVGRALRARPDAVLLLIVGAAIVGSLVVLLLFALSRPRADAGAGALPSASASALRAPKR
jgi:serine/threonine protein kinase